MNLKDLNIIIDAIAVVLIPINQILFQCLIIIIYYYLFTTMSLRVNNITPNIQQHKAFIYLVAFVCVMLDWFIWNNCMQTSLFASILIIYIAYNINTSTNISTFIGIINDSRTLVQQNNNDNKKIQEQHILEDLYRQKQEDDINLITFIPKNINLETLETLETLVKNNNPDPYEKTLINNNIGTYELKDAYKSNELPNNTLSINYTDIQLNNLYNAPQYKNIENDISDNSLGNAIHQSSIDSIDSIAIDSSKNHSSIIKQKQFLDDKWLFTEDRTYNDNCKSCLGKNIKGNSKGNDKGNNTSCNIVKFGRELQECTNQENTISEKQLNTISNSNRIEPIYKF